MPYSGEIIEPANAVMQYAMEWDVSHEVVSAKAREYLHAELDARSRAAAAKIDPRAPILVSTEIAEASPRDPLTIRYTGRATVRFLRYVYTDDMRLADEYRRDLRKRGLYAI